MNKKKTLFFSSNKISKVNKLIQSQNSIVEFSNFSNEKKKVESILSLLVIVYIVMIYYGIRFHHFSCASTQSDSISHDLLNINKQTN